MMRKLIIAAIAALTLAGCATSGNGPSPSSPDYVQQLIATVAKQCPFVLAVGTASQLIAQASGNGAIAIGVGTVNQLASAVCSAISKPTALRGAKPVVNGVRIEGTYVNR